MVYHKIKTEVIIEQKENEDKQESFENLEKFETEEKMKSPPKQIINDGLNIFLKNASNTLLNNLS